MVQPGPPIARTSLVLLWVLALGGAPAWGQEQPAAGLIKSLTGTVFIIRAGQELPATIGQSIVEGDSVKTAADGRLGITLKDGTRLSLGGGTELQLNTFAYAPAQGRLGLVIKVLRGMTTYISGRIADLAPGAVKIETPTSVIGIRGTHLLIGVEPR